MLKNYYRFDNDVSRPVCIESAAVFVAIKRSRCSFVPSRRQKQKTFVGSRFPSVAGSEPHAERDSRVRNGPQPAQASQGQLVVSRTYQTAREIQDPVLTVFPDDAEVGPVREIAHEGRRRRFQAPGGPEAITDAFAFGIISFVSRILCVVCDFK